MFKFVGPLPASKSILNRALILQSYFPELQILGSSAADDVLKLQQALQQLLHPHSEKAIKRGADQIFDLGAGGTSFRFFALRASRQPGSYQVGMSERLASRPWQEIQEVLKYFGVSAELKHNTFFIHSRGWNEPTGAESNHFSASRSLFVDSSRSSQFLSSVLLNAWNLNFDLHIRTQRSMPSESYYEMTKGLLQSLGLQISEHIDDQEKEIVIVQGQKPKSTLVSVEADMSSLFTLACAALINGEIEVTNFSQTSLQADVIGLEFLQQMGGQIQMGSSLKVHRTESLKPLRADLTQSPDLFPCLAVMCALADGESFLTGLSQLKYKESDRLNKTMELLRYAGVRCEMQGEALRIWGSSKLTHDDFIFDPDHDHRMAFAAALFNLKGVKIKVLTPEVVQKSWPEFWSILGVKP